MIRVFKYQDESWYTVYGAHGTRFFEYVSEVIDFMEMRGITTAEWRVYGS